MEILQSKNMTKNRKAIFQRPQSLIRTEAFGDCSVLKESEAVGT